MFGVETAEPEPDFTISSKGSTYQEVTFANMNEIEYSVPIVFCEGDEIGFGREVSRQLFVSEGDTVCDENYFVVENNGYSRVLQLKDIRNTVDSKYVKIMDIGTGDTAIYDCDSNGVASINMDGYSYGVALVQTTSEPSQTCIRLGDITDDADGEAGLISGGGQELRLSSITEPNSFGLVKSGSNIELGFINKGIIEYESDIFYCSNSVLKLASSDTDSVHSMEEQGVCDNDYFFIEKGGNSRLLQLVDVQSTTDSKYIKIKDVGTGDSTNFDLDSNNVAKINMDGYSYSVKAYPSDKCIVTTDITDNVGMYPSIQNSKGGILKIKDVISSSSDGGGSSA